MFQFEKFIAGRYFKTEKKHSFVSFITYFAMGGIAVGSAALIITLAIVNGFSKEIEKRLITFGSHIKIVTFSGTSVDYPNSHIKMLDSLKFVTQISPTFSKEALAKSRASLEGVLVNGVLWNQVPKNLTEYLAEGRLFQEHDSIKNPIIIGKKLSQLLSVSLDDKITLFGIDGMPTPGNSPNVIQGSVVGIYDTGMQGFDDLFIYVPLQSAQNLFKAPNKVNEINLTTTDLANVSTYVDSIETILPWPYYSRSIYQTHYSMFNWIALQQQMIPIILVVLILIAIVNVIGTLLMIIVDRTQDIGILRSLGASKKQIQRIFLWEGSLLAIWGLIIGNTIGFTFCIIQMKFGLISLPSEAYYMNTVPIALSLSDFFLVNSLTFVLSLATSFIPSVIASKLNTIDILRFQ